MQDQLKTIRKACISANPDIVKLKFGTEVRGLDGFNKPFYGIYLNTIRENGNIAIINISNEIEDKNPNKIRKISSFQTGIDTLEIIGRKIGIADVLLAIKQKYTNYKDWNDAVCDVITNIDVGFSKDYWNLFDDDITHQSPEYVAFIANLLGNDK